MRCYATLTVCFVFLLLSTISAPSFGQNEKSEQDKKAETKQDTKSESDQKKSDDSKQGDSKQADDKITNDKKTNDKKTTPPVDTPDSPLDPLMTQWADLTKKMQAAQDKYRLALEKKDRDAARDQYMKLYAQANDQIEKIRATALAIVEKDPKNERAIKTIVGIMINDANSASNDVPIFALADKLIAAKVDPKYFRTAMAADRISFFGREVFDEILMRQRETDDDNLPRVKFKTSKGDIVVELFENEAPDTVANFMSLVKSGFYSGTPFHRVIEGFMAQSGNPPEGKDELDYKIYCECYKPGARMHFTGSLSMAHAGRDTGNSGFFITFGRTPSVIGLNGKHTVFGRVIEGMDIVNKITITYKPEPGNPAGVPIDGVKQDSILEMEILRGGDKEYKPNKVVTPPANDPKKPDDKKTGENKSAEKKVDDKKSEGKKGDKADDKSGNK